MRNIRIRGGRIRRIKKNKSFCATCPETEELSPTSSPNGDDNLIRLSKQLNSMSIQKPTLARAGGKKSYIKF